MARRKERMSEGKKNIITSLIEEYDIHTAEDIQDALKDLLLKFLKIVKVLLKLKSFVSDKKIFHKLMTKLLLCMQRDLLPDKFQNK